ncbi:MAG: hypothetical protein MUF16_14320 [Burkholderiaceae bacterium]|jgi:hypothetical protein|nr:hypothetical protein [Burkholderiaceae bacterium]
MTHRWILAAALAACTMAPLAQTVYESKDKAGPVFSDKPSAGAVPVEVQPGNVVSPPVVKPAAPPAPSAAPTYRRLVITRPAEQDMVHSNTGEFGVSASLSPPLRPNDRVRVLLDGNLVPTVFRSTNLHLSRDDWQSAALGSNGEHTLQLAVVDADGKPWIESAPVRFYLRGTAVGGKRR